MTSKLPCNFHSLISSSLAVWIIIPYTTASSCVLFCEKQRPVKKSQRDEIERESWSETLRTINSIKRLWRSNSTRRLHFFLSSRSHSLVRCFWDAEHIITTHNIQFPVSPTPSDDFPFFLCCFRNNFFDFIAILYSVRMRDRLYIGFRSRASCASLYGNGVGKKRESS